MSVKRKPFLMKLMACSVVGLLGTTSIATDAHAGFKWTGPVTSQDTTFSPNGLSPAPDIHWHGESPKDAKTAMEADMLHQEDLPAPVTSETLTSADTTAQGDVISQIVAEKTAVAQQAPMLEIDGAEIAEGFGSDIPLVMAIRQIVPAKQAFAFEKDVNLSQPVSWQGGKAWPTVLSETLATVGLYAHARNDMVMIGKLDNMVAPAPQKAEAQTAPVATHTAAVPASDDITGMVISDGVAESAPAVAPANTAMSISPDMDEDMAPVTSSYYKPGAVSHAPAEGDTMGNLSIAKESQRSMLPPAAQQNAATDAMMPSPVEGTDMMSASDSIADDAAWSAQTGETLRSVITTWAEKENIKLYWSIDYDYRVQENVAFDGTFREALEGLLNSFSDMDPQPYGQLHETSDGEVLVIKAYDSVG